MKNTITDNIISIARTWGVFASFVIAFFFLQGRVYREGYLAGFGLDLSLYPLDTRDAFIEALKFYISTANAWMPGAFYIGLSITVYSLGNRAMMRRYYSAQIINDDDKKCSKNRKILNTFKKAGSRAIKICERLREPVLPVAIVAAMLYLIILILLLVIFPYYWSSNESAERFNKNAESWREAEAAGVPCVEQAVTIVLVRSKQGICGIIVALSEQMVTLQTAQGIVTFPMGEIHRMDGKRADR